MPATFRTFAGIFMSALRERSPDMLISVVMPVYNGMPYLHAALDSLLAQTERDFEVIAVDDGSEDATPDILDQYAARDARVRPIRRPREGIVSALNAGLAAANGELIARMDADDLCKPDRLALQRRCLEERPDIGLAATRVEYGGDPAVHRGFSLFVEWTNTLLEPEEIDLNRFVETPLAHPSVMFRRALVDRHGGYRDGPFPEDYELWLRWLDAGVRMIKLPQKLVAWREREDRLSRVHPRYAIEAFYRLKAEYLAKWLRRAGWADRVVVWGAGRTARRRAELLTEWGATIHAYVDIDPRKIGQTLSGRPVWPVDRLPAPGHFFVLPYVGSRGARALIHRCLTDLGYRLGRDFLPAA